MYLTPKMTAESPMTAAEGKPVLAASMSGRYPRNVYSSANPMSAASGITIASTFAACLHRHDPTDAIKEGTLIKMHTVERGQHVAAIETGRSLSPKMRWTSSELPLLGRRNVAGDFFSNDTAGLSMLPPTLNCRQCNEKGRHQTLLFVSTRCC